jgi:ABC-type amino acid transport substrate-binding protein
MSFLDSAIRAAIAFLLVATIGGCATTAAPEAGGTAPAASAPAPSGSGSPTLAKIARSGSITLGYRETAVPFSFAAPGKEPTGYSIDICRAVVEGLRNDLKMPTLAVKWEPVTAEDRIRKVRDGTVDLECGSTTQTINRRKDVDFSLITFVDGGSFMTKAGANLLTLKDLDGKRVAVLPGTSTEAALNRGLQAVLARAQITPVKDYPEGLALLRDGRVDALAADRVILIGLAIASKQANAYALADELYSYEPYGLVMRRDADFRLAVDRVIASLYRSGQIGPIYGRWFGSLGQPSPMLGAMYLLQSLPE